MVRYIPDNPLLKPEEKKVEREEIAIDDNIVHSAGHTKGTGLIDGKPFRFDMNAALDNKLLVDMMPDGSHSERVFISDLSDALRERVKQKVREKVAEQKEMKNRKWHYVSR